MLNKKLSILAATLTLVFSAQANATLTVDTGTPDGSGFALALDSNDSFAGQISFANSVQINAINTYLDDLGNGAGTFTVALYSDNSIKHTPSALLDSASATFSSKGWNGASNLNWSVAAGTYWVAIEGQDPFSGGLIGVAPTGGTSLLTHTAFNAGSGYQKSDGLGFGLQVDSVSAVPEPESYALMLAGLGLLGVIARRRKTA